jgi:hypothetical protein
MACRANQLGGIGSTPRETLDEGKIKTGSQFLRPGRIDQAGCRAMTRLVKIQSQTTSRCAHIKGCAMKFATRSNLKMFFLCSTIMPAIANAGVPGPRVAVAKSLDRIIVAPSNKEPTSGCAPTATIVDFRVTTSGFKGKDIESDIVVTAGRAIIGKMKFAWDLTGVRPGNYMAIVDAKSEQGELARTTAQLQVAECP